MGRTKLTHSVPVVVLLMALALIGWPVLEFIFVTVVTIGVGAVLLYTFLGFAYGMDRVVDYFYTPRG